MRAQALRVRSTFVHFYGIDFVHYRGIDFVHCRGIDFVHYRRIDFVHSCDVTLYITVESPVHSEEARTMIMIEASIQSVY